MKKLSTEEILKRIQIAHGDVVTIVSGPVRKGNEDWVVALDKDFGQFEVRLHRLIRGCGHRKRGRENAKTTCLAKYGVDNVSKYSEFSTALTKDEINARLEKNNRKCRLVSGDHLPSGPQEFLDEEFGVFYNSVSKVMRVGQDHPSRKLAKMAATNQVRYGGVSPMNGLAVKEKQQSTMMQRYGTKHALQVEDFARKSAKKQKHTSILTHWATGEELICEASYEKAVATFLNSKKMDFTWKPMPVWLPKLKRTYFPDAIVEGRYIEIKGYMRDHSLQKWTEFQEINPTAELWNKEYLIQQKILSPPAAAITAARPVYVLAGPSGSGKTTLAKELDQLFEVVEQDKTRLWDTQVKKYCEVACDRPLLLVTTMKVASLLSRLSLSQLVVILETEDIYAARLHSRGGAITPTAMKRHSRLSSVAQKFNGFTGTYDQVKKQLISLAS